MQPRDNPGTGLGTQLLSELDSRAGGRSLPLLLLSLPLLFRSSELSSLLCGLVTTPLSCPHFNFGMSSSFCALAATAALLLFSILLISASRSNFQMFFLRYAIHRRMFSRMSTRRQGGLRLVVLQAVLCLGALYSRVHQVVILPAVLRVVLRRGVQLAVRHPAIRVLGVHAGCRMSRLLG